MSFDDMMSQLRKEYVSTLPEKIQTIRHFLNSGDALGVRGVFHKLKGTGATYGVPELSSLGETLEAYVESNPQDLKSAVPDALDILSQVHVSRLKDEAFNIQADTRFLRIRKLIKKS